MKTPMSEKTDGMKRAIDALFPGTLKAIASGHCPACLKPITGFRDKLSIREFEISGLCQECQDMVFKDTDE